MGNYKFRLSDMIPNAWFYKLKDMNRVKNQLKTKQGIKEKKHTPSSSSSSSISSSSISSSIAEPNNPYMSDQRKSYHFTRDFNDFHPNPPKVSEKKFTTEPPRKSTRRRRIRNRALNRMPDPSSHSDSDRALTPDTLDVMLCKCRVQNDIVIDFVENDTKLNRRLPPIITKKTPIEAQRNGYGSSRRVSSNSTSPGVRLRTNTPRIGNRRIHGGGGGGRKSVSLNSNSNSSPGSSRRNGGTESFAVVKTSKDPRRDFRESMVEMIVENNISASKDLEELLANYLSLNSDEYHDLIINVFKQIWIDFFHVPPK